MAKLSVIIPAYNEKNSILPLLSLVESVALIGGISKEIIIVDDGSTDGTRDILAALPPDPNRLVILLPQNCGKGSAIRAALSRATGDWLLIQDADLEYDPQDYNTLLTAALADAPVVYGSRELKKQEQRYSGISYYLGGRFLSWLTNALYGTRLTDEPTCYKLFKTDLLKSLPLVCRRFEFCPEVTALIARRKIPIAEVPIHYYPRGKNEGKKINWRDGAEAIWTLLKYRFKKI